MSEPGSLAMAPFVQSPMHLHSPADVPVLADVLAAPDVESAWTGLRKRWGDITPVEVEAGVRAWLVTGYSTIVKLGRESGLVTTDASVWNRERHGPLPAILRPFQLEAGQTVETAAGPVHARLRAPLEEVLAAVDAAQIKRVTGSVCDDLVDKLASMQRADLMAEYVVPVARRALGAALGLDLETGRQVFELADDLAAGQADASIIDDLSFLLSGQVMRDAGGELTPFGLLAQHSAYGDDREAVGGLLSLVAGASRGVQAWLGQTLLLALTDQQFRRRLAGGRLGTDEALDEVLWYASPVSLLAPRFALKTGRLLSETTWVNSGDAVLLAAGAAASDPEIRGESPWEELGNRAHLAWGAGSRRCPGQRPARLIVRTAVEVLLRRVEPVLDAGASEVRWAPDIRFRRPQALPVRLRQPETMPRP
ncbi:cytochrome P450 family protein [Myceligenerans halotolerans]